MPASRPTVDRFHEKYAIDPDTGCWNWTAAVSRGYGYVTRQRGKPVRAHRFAYEHFVCEIPDGMMVLHSCHNALCVNPAHLHLGTHAENMAEMRAAGRGHTPRPVPKSVRPYRYTTPEQRAGILEMLQRGEKILRIAQRFGVDRKTVRNLRPDLHP